MSLQNFISNGERISCVDLKEEFNQTSESGKQELTYVELTGDHHNRQILCLNNNEDVLKDQIDIEVFNCEYCDFVCSKLSDLQNHIPIHLPVITKNIESYGAEGSPKQEQKIHVCDECGDIFVFTKSKTNQIELQIYKGDSEDSCDKCSNTLIKVGDVSKSSNESIPNEIATCTFSERGFLNSKDADAHIEQNDIDKKLLYPNVEEEVLAHDVNDLNAHTQQNNIDKKLLYPNVKEEVLGDDVNDLNAHTQQNNIDKKLLYQNVEEEVLAHDVNDDSGYFENVIVKQEKPITVKQEKQNSSAKNQDKIKQMIIKKQNDASITEKYKIKSDAKYRPYACSKCTFRSVEENTLKKHYRTHYIEKRFACPQCNYKGEKAVNLKNHLKIHSDEKPHGCSKCQYRTNNFPNLKRHERQHTVEKPFPCTKCDYKAFQKIALQNHMKSIHSL